MGRHDDKWSDRHRSAIGYAICEQGMSSTAAVEAAKRGELGLAAFRMPASTAREIAQAYERGEIEPPDVQAAGEDTARALQFDLDRRRAQLLAQPDDQRKWGALRTLADEQKAILAMDAARRRNTKPPSDTKDVPEERHDVPSLLANLQNNGDNGTTAPVQSEVDAAE